MNWLNYHHLYYFWRIAREGGLAKAAHQLRLSHSTLSAQLRALEDALGAQLFQRKGRVLVLTPLGEQVATYADDIFRLGREVLDIARGEQRSRRPVLRAGIVASLPKAVAFGMLKPGLGESFEAGLFARQGTLEELIAELASGRLHLVLSEQPPPESTSANVFAHLLGSSEILLYGVPDLAKRYRKGFPKSLEGAPLLLPSPGKGLRPQLDRWFADRGISVRIAGELDDSGLMRVAGLHGLGLLPVRAALRAEVEDLDVLEFVGTFDRLLERYYVLSPDKKARHPLVSAIIERGRLELDGAPRSRKASEGT